MERDDLHEKGLERDKGVFCVRGDDQRKDRMQFEMSKISDSFKIIQTETKLNI